MAPSSTTLNHFFSHLTFSPPSFLTPQAHSNPSNPSPPLSHPEDSRDRLTASIVAVLRGDSSVSGTVRFEQASEQAPTVITYDIQGNDPSAERGMHIHQFGDNTNGCTSAGPHCTFFFLSSSFSSISSPLSSSSLYIIWRSGGGKGQVQFTWRGR